ncbi:MAG: hypothetical protein II836_11175, partial [Clostridia bacterium]|nr:hypothetical protein [Clostridia bacterium]
MDPERESAFPDRARPFCGVDVRIGHQPFLFRTIPGQKPPGRQSTFIMTGGFHHGKTENRRVRRAPRHDDD